MENKRILSFLLLFSYRLLCKPDLLNTRQVFLQSKSLDQHKPPPSLQTYFLTYGLIILISVFFFFCCCFFFSSLNITWLPRNLISKILIVKQLNNVSFTQILISTCHDGIWIIILYLSDFKTTATFLTNYPEILRPKFLLWSLLPLPSTSSDHWQ